MIRVLIDTSRHWFTHYASPTSGTAHYIEIPEELHQRFVGIMEEFDKVQSEIHQAWREQAIPRTKAVVPAIAHGEHAA